ncbi:MAG: hypothetical protein LC437_00665, partial [Thiohalomonas sp.]|nr:hypothetical protein [Thiohalomonas sp.]
GIDVVNIKIIHHSYNTITQSELIVSNTLLVNVHPFILLLASPFFASGRLLLVEGGRKRNSYLRMNSS